MGKLFGGGDSGAGAIAEENRKQRERLAQEEQTLKVEEGQREAAARRVRIGGGGVRRLITSGFRGVESKTKKLGG